MQLHKTITALISGICLLVIILDGKTAMAGASEGIDMCVRSIIPALFPFFVLSNLFTGGCTGNESKLLRPLGRLFQVPPGAESLLIPAFLGGYPVGAQSIAAARKNGQLSQSNARRMMAFCNNAGPTFLFGIIAPSLSLSKAWLLWGIQLFSAWFVSVCIPPQKDSAGNIQIRTVTCTEAMFRAITATCSVCGWVVLFRVLIVFLKKWFLWLLPIAGQTAVIGFLELANGCFTLGQIPNPDTQFVICSAMLSFGGLCVTMQTLSAAEGADISLYFPGKVLQTSFAALLSCLLCSNYRHFGFFSIPIIGIFFLYLRKKKINVEIRRQLVYNTYIYWKRGNSHAVSEKN